jgi:hypothetical protein
VPKFLFFRNLPKIGSAIQEKTARGGNNNEYSFFTLQIG